MKEKAILQNKSSEFEDYTDYAVFNIIDEPRVAFLKEVGVYSINVAQGKDAIKWLESNGLGEEELFNIDTDTMVEVSWGHDDVGIADYAQNCFGPNIYECLARCLDGFVSTYISNAGRDRSDYRLNWSAHEVLEAKGITIDRVIEIAKILRGDKEEIILLIINKQY